MSYTDVETLTVTWLKTRGLATMYLTRTDGGINVFKAMPKASPLPSIVLSRVGGGPRRRSDVPEDVARISFNCWAATRDAAVDISLMLVDDLETLGPFGGFTDGASRLVAAETVSWIWLPDPEGDTPRYVVDALVSAVTG